MSVEIKQLIIKSTIVDSDFVERAYNNSAIDVSELKEVIMEVCNEMIANKIRDIQER